MPEGTPLRLSELDWGGWPKAGTEKDKLNPANAHILTPRGLISIWAEDDGLYEMYYYRRKEDGDLTYAQHNGHEVWSEMNALETLCIINAIITEEGNNG